MSINFEQFLAVEIRSGKIISASDNIKAKKPAYILEINFGEEIGTKISSAQLTKNYRKSDLIGKNILAVMNFSPRNIAGISSEVLTLATVDDINSALLIEADDRVTLGALVS